MHCVSCLGSLNNPKGKRTGDASWKANGFPAEHRDLRFMSVFTDRSFRWFKRSGKTNAAGDDSHRTVMESLARSCQDHAFLQQNALSHPGRVRITIHEKSTCPIAINPCCFSSRSSMVALPTAATTPGLSCPLHIDTGKVCRCPYNGGLLKRLKLPDASLTTNRGERKDVHTCSYQLHLGVFVVWMCFC